MSMDKQLWGGASIVLGAVAVSGCYTANATGGEARTPRTENATSGDAVASPAESPSAKTKAMPDPPEPSAEAPPAAVEEQPGKNGDSAGVHSP